MCTAQCIPFAGIYPIENNRDEDSANRIIKFISNNKNAFERTSAEGHVTSSAFIIDSSATKTLLTLHSKLGLWLPLGGHCDGIRDPRFVAFREAYEESGLTHLESVSDQVFDIDIHKIPSAPGINEHFHYDVRYLFLADATERLSITEESSDLRWINISDIPMYTDLDSVLILRDKLIVR